MEVLMQGKRAAVIPVEVGQVREAEQAPEVRARGVVRPDAVKVLQVVGPWSRVRRGTTRSSWIRTENVEKRFPIVVSARHEE
jgi:hypothetical protein